MYIICVNSDHSSHRVHCHKILNHVYSFSWVSFVTIKRNLIKFCLKSKYPSICSVYIAATEGKLACAAGIDLLFLHSVKNIFCCYVFCCYYSALLLLWFTLQLQLQLQQLLLSLLLHQHAIGTVFPVDTGAWIALNPQPLEVHAN